MANRLFIPDGDSAAGGVFEALTALAKRPPKKERRRMSVGEVAASVARLQAGHKRKRKRLMRQAMARRPKGRLLRGVYGERIQDRMLAVMQPGQWHWTADIMAAAGLHRDARGRLWQVLLRKGLVRRRSDPDGTCNRDGVVFRLWQLTKAGELEREKLLAFYRGEIDRPVLPKGGGPIGRKKKKPG